VADGKGPARRVPARALEDLDVPGSRDESSDQAGRFSFKRPHFGSTMPQPLYERYLTSTRYGERR